MSETSSSRRTGRGVLLLILLAALVLRVGFVVTRPVSDHALEGLPDQLQYLNLARNLVSGQGYWFVDARVGAKVYAFRTPGYPLFLAACGANVRAALIVQSGLDTSTVWAVYLLSLMLFRRRWGDALHGLGGDEQDSDSPRQRWMPLIAAAIVAFSPFLIYFCGLILSETLFTAMMVWGMVCLLAGRGLLDGKPRTWLWLVGGLLLASSVPVRPSAIALPIVLGIGAAFVNPGGRGAYQSQQNLPRLRWPLPVGTTMLLLTVLALTPWALRNYSALHRWVPLETNSGYTLYDGYNPDATGASNQRFVQSMPQLRSMGEAQRSKYLENLALEFIRAHPRRAIELAVAKLVRTWSPVPLSAEYSQGKYQLIGLAYALPFDLLVLWGLVVGNLSRSAKVFVLLPAIYLSAVHMLTVGSLRYRLPAEPPLAVLAASALMATTSGRSTVSGIGRQ